MNENKDTVNGLALKSGTWYVISSVLLKSVSIITTPIFTRILSQEEYGITATFSSWCSILIVFCTLNLTYSIGQAKIDYPEMLDKFIGSMQLLSLGISTIIAFSFVILIKPIAKFMELPEVGIFLLALYLVSAPSISFYLNGCRYRYRYKESIAISWFTASGNILISFVLIYLFNGNKAIYRMVGTVVPTLLLSMFIWFDSLKKKNIVFNTIWWKYGLMLSVPLVAHEISLNILAQSDRIFITKLCNASDTALYSIAYNYGILMLVITSAVSNGWLPWFHDKYNTKQFSEIKHNSKFIVLLGCYVGLACIAFAPEAIYILGGKEYLAGMYCVAPITLGVVCQYIYTHYINIELHLKKTRYVPICTVVSAVVNIALNAMFIPKFGFVAAAYTTLLGYFVLMILHFIVSRYIFKVHLYSDKFMFASFLITAVAGEMLVLFYENGVIRYILICIGFASFLYVFRKFIVNFIIKRLIVSKKP